MPIPRTESLQILNAESMQILRNNFPINRPTAERSGITHGIGAIDSQQTVGNQPLKRLNPLRIEAVVMIRMTFFHPDQTDCSRSFSNG